MKARLSRRRFLGAVAGLAAAPALARAARPGVGSGDDAHWDAGSVRHLIPTANHERLLLKVSLRQAQARVVLRIDGRNVPGRRSDTAGRFWRFDVDSLQPATTHRLQLQDAKGRALCDPWPLRTFPAPDTLPERMRIVAYTCAGGYDGLPAVKGKTWFLDMAARRRLLDRALSFRPDAVVANGDHIYWDQRTALNKPPAYVETARHAAKELGSLDWARPMLGTDNEATFTRICDLQIAELYGTRLRSTPAFFIGDDHDLFENDEGDAQLLTLPPDAGMLDGARSTQLLYYPEFLPDPHRSPYLEGGSAPDREPGLSESFGTLRYGRLLECLLYDTKRHCSVGGVHARMVPERAEKWLLERTLAEDTAHLMHMPSTPFGWSAGKLGEWYPDVLLGNGTLGIEQPKPHWPSGWWAQHQRLMAALGQQKRRAGLILQGDLHASGYGVCTKSGSLDLSPNPVHLVLTGTLGSGDLVFPSVVRSVPTTVSSLLTVDTRMAPTEKNGFTVVDVLPDRVDIQVYTWRPPEDAAAIDTMAPAATFSVSRT